MIQVKYHDCSILRQNIVDTSQKLQFLIGFQKPMLQFVQPFVDCHIYMRWNGRTHTIYTSPRHQASQTITDKSQRINTNAFRNQP